MAESVIIPLDICVASRTTQHPILLSRWFMQVTCIIIHVVLAISTRSAPAQLNRAQQRRPGTKANFSTFECIIIRAHV